MTPSTSATTSGDHGPECTSCRGSADGCRARQAARVRPVLPALLARQQAPGFGPASGPVNTRVSRASPPAPTYPSRERTAP